MLFRVTALVPAASPAVNLSVTLSGPPIIEVVVEPGPDHAAAVRATTQVKPTEKHMKVFDDLEAGRLPQGSRAVEALSHDTIQPGDDLDRWLISLVSLPESFRTYVNAEHDRLSAAIDTCWQLLRWRYDVDVRRRFASQTLEWSRDMKVWHRMPSRGVATARFTRGLPHEPSAAPEVQRMAAEGLSEPLAFDLLREAVDLQHENTRSALVIAMTALEIGIKSHIATTVPAARWLIEELPSPPVQKMLTDYIPTLATQPSSEAIVVPPRLVATIAKAVTARNRVVHKGLEPARASFLEEVLEAVRDILYLLDAFAGQSWALNHLSTQTRRELGLGRSTQTGAQR